MGSFSSAICKNINIFIFFKLPLTIPRYQLLCPDETKWNFLFLLPLSVPSSEVELHIQLARC